MSERESKVEEDSMMIERRRSDARLESREKQGNQVGKQHVHACMRVAKKSQHLTKCYEKRERDRRGSQVRVHVPDSEMSAGNE